MGWACTSVNRKPAISGASWSLSREHWGGACSYQKERGSKLNYANWLFHFSGLRSLIR